MSWCLSLWALLALARYRSHLQFERADVCPTEFAKEYCKIVCVVSKFINFKVLMKLVVKS